MVVRRIFGENGAEEGAVAQRRRRLVGQSVAGGADRALLAFALQETDVSTFGSHKKVRSQAMRYWLLLKLTPLNTYSLYWRLGIKGLSGPLGAEGMNLLLFKLTLQ